MYRAVKASGPIALRALETLRSLAESKAKTSTKVGATKMSEVEFIDTQFGVYVDPFAILSTEISALRKRVEQLERTTEQKPHAAEQTAWFIEYYYGSRYYTAHDGFLSLKTNTDKCKARAVRCKSREDADAVIRILNLIGCEAVLLNSVTMAPVEVTELNYD